MIAEHGKGIGRYKNRYESSHDKANHKPAADTANKIYETVS